MIINLNNSTDYATYVDPAEDRVRVFDVTSEDDLEKAGPLIARAATRLLEESDTAARIVINLHRVGG
ncbi:hypothetical protein AWB78_05333 [Caballeronia calidae]|uniref:Uncharacterized protein n=1 Tax=Caballeronia calidae TaxID=1777139 RepID=A0A158DL72_9BURK|nr:hypothetical protein [Caballeronia calidae]SAK95369.1 hypothetical protein AWB78_05333 [Caballeronia calidae]